ncbi:MAG: FAD-dependent monooxygenase, partial [Ktedonobacteraceae bacterium]|nr:FAD-dependent monooxygenase [Ktedonobacteraceae bacterium]
MSSSSLHVIVIGGGIGGLCLAQALKAADVSVAVYERNPSPTDWLQGYRININPTGSHALYECLPPVLWEAFIATAGKPSAGFGFLTEQLKELLVLDEALMSGKTNSPDQTHHPVSRIALRHILLADLDDITHFDKTFERYEQSPTGKVTAFFADGSSATGDVLVGADGANSRIRKQLLPHAQRVETGAVSIGGKLLLNDETRAWLPRSLTTRMNMIMPPDRYFMFNAVFDHVYSPEEGRRRIGEHAEAAGLRTELLFHNVENYILWATAAHRDDFPADVDTFDGPALQQLTIKMIAGWHPDLHRVVVESDPASINFISLKTSVPVEPWETTNVTLLGDALHNMTPLAGMGANTA